MKKILLPILILAIGISGFLYLKQTKPEKEPVDVPEQAWVVDIIPVELATLSPTITLYGRVETPRQATLRTPTLSLTANTEVVKLKVLEGQQVRKGQVLVQLDDKDSRLNLQQRQADINDIQAQIDIEKQRHNTNLASIKNEEKLLSLRKSQVSRAAKLEKKKMASQSTLDDARQAVEQQKLAVNRQRLEIKSHKARLAQLKAKLNRAIASRDMAKLEIARTQIKAPFSGMIANVLISVGDRVRSSDPLIELYDTNALEIRAQIPSRYQDIVLSSLAKKQTLQAGAKVYDTMLQLDLNRVSGQINKANGGIDGLFAVTKGEKVLRLGQFLNLSLTLPSQAEVIALPFEAVYGTNRIYKLVDERMESLIINSVGEQVTPDGKSQILIQSDDLKAEDKIIITQLPNAMDGLKVIVNNGI